MCHWRLFWGSLTSLLDLQKPTAIQYYNKHTASVDKSDQMVLPNTTVRKKLANGTNKLFFHLVDLSATNDFIPYELQGRQQNHFKFAKSLCKELLAAATDDPDYKKPRKAGHFTRILSFSALASLNSINTEDEEHNACLCSVQITHTKSWPSSSD